MRDRRNILAVVLSALLLGVTCSLTAVRQLPSPLRIETVERGSIIRSWEYVDGFPNKVAVFQTVFWEPRDTNSLRELIETTGLVHGKSVLEIGTGSGLVSLCCLREGAARVVATDVNQHAIANAQYNANVLGLAERFETRLVSTRAADAFAVIHPGETFDVIVSNPPWEDAVPRTIDEYALYDHDFQLLRSILAGSRSRLNSGGRLLLAYGCRDAIETLDRLASDFDLQVERLDPRSLDTLPEVFIPGMLVEVFPRTGRW